MGQFGTGELLIIALVALVVFGPSRLPELARSFGRSVAEFRRAAQEVVDDVRDAVEDEEPEVTKGQRSGGDTP
ncbi:MAG: twin-arginine translocase TatA/TatE family subunit [Clostridia bacterium]|nr:twin-arginine translocase TatA/TatE family subunit [Clostridia bacterium]